MKLEQRYIILKQTDLDRAPLTDHMREMLEVICANVTIARIDAGKTMRLEAVVIEKDWPEYEPTLALLSARVDGQERPAGKKVGELMVEVGFSGNKVSELVQFILDAVAEGGMTAECGEELGRHLAGLDVGEVSPDANVELNRKMLLDRSKVGLEKYGVTTEREDLTPAQWAQHAIEEALDFANYLQALKRKLEDLNNE